jgi:hypothetical protein
MGEVEGLSQLDKRKYLTEKLAGKLCFSLNQWSMLTLRFIGQVIGTSEKGYLSVDYALGAGTKNKLHGVCSTAFRLAYSISSGTLDAYRAAVRNGFVVCTPCDGEVPINDKSAFTSESFRKLLVKNLKHRGRELSQEQWAALTIPHTVNALACYSWMDCWFRSIGDLIPNSSNLEIHLEPQDIKEIWDEYRLDMEHRSLEHLQYDAFCKLWVCCFSYVKIREYKAVSGKCNTCALLSYARRTRRDPKARLHITQMHALHRAEYMGERLAYYMRREMAMANPLLYLSIISDGMAQAHCLLPFLSNLKQFSDPLTQHLQACYVHGQAIIVYRTFHNVCLGANMQIHCFLLTLENARQRNGYLPRTIFYQIDGGSENVAKVVMGICELLVSRRLVDRIVLTRLLVGHTHEDIDGKFALIWKKIRDRHILTPQEYKIAIAAALEYKELFVLVHDLFVVPDYTSLLSSLIDGNFGRYAKGEWTHLQFEFVAVDVSADFPLGVKTTWRQYCADSVVRIVEDAEAECGFADELLRVKSFPAAVPEDGIVEGAYLLQSLPVGIPAPEAFEPDSRAKLEKVVATFKKMFRSAPEAIEQWEVFAADHAPPSDDAGDYVANMPLHIPFCDVLFSRAAMDATRMAVAKATTQKFSAISRVADAVDSVTWSRR